MLILNTNILNKPFSFPAERSSGALNLYNELVIASSVGPMFLQSEILFWNISRDDNIGELIGVNGA